MTFNKHMDAWFTGRDNIGTELQRSGLTGLGVEVGTHRGEFARSILCSWQSCERFYCVDHWAVPPGYEYQAKLLVQHLHGGVDRETDFQRALQLVADFKDRVELVRADSAVAVNQFADNSLSFVYLDGDHSSEGIRRDLAIWWPKVKLGGWFCGHDVLCPGGEADAWDRSIYPAVAEFCDKHRQAFLVIKDHGADPASFLIVKE